MMKIGWAQRDVSTDQPVVIPGQFHMRVSKGVLDPILVTALTLDGGEDYVIFLQCDTVVIPEGILNEVREKVRHCNSEIDPMKILMNSTHTHTGPLLGAGDVTSTWGKVSQEPYKEVEITPPGEYRTFFTEMACQAVCESFASRTEGSIAYGYGFATVAHSRRVVYTKDWAKCGGRADSMVVDGHAKMYGNTNDESFSHYEAGTDSFANFLFTFDKVGALSGAIINVPCPSQNSEQEWFLSADYWHDVRCELKKRFGDIYILPQCAAAGDLSPRQLHYKTAEQRRYRLKYADYKLMEELEQPIEMYRRRDIALRICDAFAEVYSWASKEKYDDVPVVHSVKNISINRRIITEEQYRMCCEQEAACRQQESFVATGDKKADLMTNSITRASAQRYRSAIKKYEDQQKDACFPMEMHVIKVGNVAFASNQFELYIDYQHRIQARSPFEQTFVIQLCAQPDRGSGTYLPTERGVWGVGYSATFFCNMASPEGGQRLVDETVAELERLHCLE